VDVIRIPILACSRAFAALFACSLSLPLIAGAPASATEAPPSPRAPAAAAVAKPEELCPRLASVMAAATGNFATLRGKGSEAAGWEATVRLPGMRSCTIEGATDDDAPPFRYRCTIVEEVDATAAGARREGTQQLLSRCLGESWHADELRHPGNIAVFFASKKSPLLIELSQREWLSRYSVTLTVNAPPAPMTLVRSGRGGATGLAVNIDTAVDFKSEGAGFGNVVHAFAELLGANLVIDAGMTGKVTLDRRSVPLHEALDAVCAQAGCAWSFHTAQERPELYIRRKRT
jgi:hypothetical protein